MSAGQNARLIVSVCMGLLLGLHPAPRPLIAPFLLLRALVLVHACPGGYPAPETLRFFLGVDVVLTALACVLIAQHTAQHSTAQTPLCMGPYTPSASLLLWCARCVLGWLHETSVYASWVRADQLSVARDRFRHDWVAERLDAPSSTTFSRRSASSATGDPERERGREASQASCEARRSARLSARSDGSASSRGHHQ